MRRRCLFPLTRGLLALRQLTLLLALTLTIGILVDDSVVVLENIERHLKMKKKPKQAALDGRAQIGLAAITITLVDVAIYVPVPLPAASSARPL